MRILTFALFIFFCNSATAKDAITISNEISDKSVRLFYENDFESINSMDDEFRNKQSRLPDGRWKLTFVYHRLGNVSKRGATDEWKLKFANARKWRQQTPYHPAPYIAKAKLLIAYAWDIRGSGWANTVSEAQWHLFHKKIAEARKILDDSRPISGSHPLWFLLMEKIAISQGWSPETFDDLFTQGTKRYPTYYFLYFGAADYLQPRWHGSKKELRRFVNRAVELSRDKEGYTLYTRIYWSQLWALKDKTFSPGYADWKFMKQGFEDIARDYPDSVWNLNAFAYYACMAKDWDTSNQLLKKVGDTPHMSIWETMSSYYTCKTQSLKNIEGPPSNRITTK